MKDTREYKTVILALLDAWNVEIGQCEAWDKILVNIKKSIALFMNKLESDSQGKHCAVPHRTAVKIHICSHRSTLLVSKVGYGYEEQAVHKSLMWRCAHYLRQIRALELEGAAEEKARALISYLLSLWRRKIDAPAGCLRLTSVEAWAKSSMCRNGFFDVMDIGFVMVENARVEFFIRIGQAVSFV